MLARAKGGRLNAAENREAREPASLPACYDDPKPTTLLAVTGLVLRGTLAAYHSCISERAREHQIPRPVTFMTLPLALRSVGRVGAAPSSPVAFHVMSRAMLALPTRSET